MKMTVSNINEGLGFLQGFGAGLGGKGRLGWEVKENFL